MSDGGDIRPIATLSREVSQLDLRLMIWLSPSFPVGAFAYSHGLEWAAERAWVCDRASLEAWIADLLEHGGIRNDLILIAHCVAAIGGGHPAELSRLNELALALQPSAERWLETAQQGGSFLDAIAAGWNFDRLDGLRARLGSEVAYPIAVAVAASGHAIAPAPTLAAYALAFVASLVSAAIRLSVIGQTDGQRILAALLPRIAAAAGRAATASLDDIGGCAFRSDLASLAHETQYTRLFRS